ncbi:hypothetical protein M23134_06927 [Microscilla marina ATCC 23134]|uniref:Uncharacterized protein n=1 Tax=Microscilla marina ATCC 23134 TaxID=313606 RepID=A1ZQB7_MICM2|nr:hypothetical protein M23134_06927 [Microscilla marina ATCC 23134]
MAFGLRASTQYVAQFGLNKTGTLPDASYTCTFIILKD